MSDETRRWTLLPEEFEELKGRVGKINDRAVRRGFTGTMELTGSRRMATSNGPGGVTRTYPVVDATLVGSPPAYGGWRLLAAVDSVPGESGSAGFVVRSSPGVGDISVDRSILQPGRCQHCGSRRANRKYTYLVESQETGEQLQVGSTCLKDFLGWEVMPPFVEAPSLDDMSGSGSFLRSYDPVTVVAAAVAAKELYEWVPSSAPAGRRPTRDVVEAYLYGTSKADRQLQAELDAVMPESVDTAHEVIAYLLESLDDSSGYEGNLRACLKAEGVDARHLGIAVSAVSAYDRALGIEARRSVEKSRWERLRETVDYAGGLGARVTVSGEVTMVRAFDNTYGYTTTTSHLIVVEGECDSKPVVVKMFTSAQWSFDVEEHDRVVVSGSVKDYDEYRGVKQTQLSRPKLLDRTVNQ